MKKKLLFIINPKAGRTAVRNDLFEIIVAFSKAGYEVVVYPTTGPTDAERKMSEEGALYDLVVCAGGDGTLQNTISGYMNMGTKKVPIGYIPVGTTNDFARSLRISRKPLEAAIQIVKGEECFIDVGKLNEKYFMYIAAFGIFTDISYNTKQSLKKVIGHSAYLLEAVRNLGNFKSYRLKADFDGAVITGDYIFGMITNSYSVAGFRVRGSAHVALDDGKFDCLFIKSPQNVAEFQQILSGIVTNNIEGNEMFFDCKASKISVISEEIIPWTIDGEFAGDYQNLTISNQKQAVGIYLENSAVLEGITEAFNELAASVDEEQDEDTYYND
ncbi:MAG: diacylglycerol kinase family lipid kinase [Eubacteriales bacterium]|nr:diacylglycerol kinase family lipid kinase [Eubacteriales bacterium]